MRWLLAVLFVAVFLSVVVRVSAYTVPKYDGLVNDFANILPEDAEMELEQSLLAYSQATAAAEIAVVTIQSLEGEPVEYVSQDFFDEWSIGKKNTDSGVLLLIAVDERELRIQTGYGVEGKLPDSVTDRIIRDEMVPKLKESDYMGAVTAGVQAVQGNLSETTPVQLGDNDSLPWFLEILRTGGFVAVLFVMAVSYLAAFLGRTTSWWLGGVLGAVLGLFLGSFVGMLVAGAIGLLLDYILSKNYKQWNLEGKHTSWARSLGGFHSTGYRSSSSSKGFSFGGGRSGGGGASGKW